MLKCDIRSATISYSAYKAKERRKIESELKERLDYLEIQNHNNENVFDEYVPVKNELEAIMKIQTQGKIIRSRAKFIREGEKNTKFFLNLEKRNHEIKHIKSLINENGLIINDPAEILNEQKTFYSNLYSEILDDPNNDIDKNKSIFQIDESLSKLNETTKTICETELSLAELAEALKRMPNNKTPGSDGFSTEFYKFFWIDIQHIVYKSFVSAEQNGKLSIEQRRGILSLIPKPNKDLRQLSSWRPLSLLNTDYKILTKVLANRLQIVINNLVAFDQSGYIKGRFIGTNIRTMADLIEYSNNTHES
jgi:hypothetical protein